jgi:hypothetical protein
LLAIWRSCFGWAGNKQTAGSFYSGNLTYTTTYNITCSNNSGQQAFDSVTITVTQAPQTCQDPNATNYGGPLPCRYESIPTVNITANPMNVNYNGTSTVTWNSTNAVTCNATGGTGNWSGSKPINGSFYTGNLTSTTTYNITCTSSTGQTANDSVTVTVAEQNPANITGTSANASCNSATLNGSVITNGAPTQVWFEWGANGSLTNSTAHQTFNSNSSFSQYISGLTQNTSYSYRAMASNINGSSVGQTLSFTTLNCIPTATLDANPANIQAGQSSTLSWSSTNATYCSAPWMSGTATSGSKVVYPTTTTNYSVTCYNSATGQSATDTTVVTVNSVLPTVTLTADSYNVNYNGNTFLRWFKNSFLF